MRAAKWHCGAVPFHAITPRVERRKKKERLGATQEWVKDDGKPVSISLRLSLVQRERLALAVFSESNSEFKVTGREWKLWKPACLIFPFRFSFCLETNESKDETFSSPIEIRWNTLRGSMAPLDGLYQSSSQSKRHDNKSAILATPTFKPFYKGPK